MLVASSSWVVGHVLPVGGIRDKAEKPKALEVVKKWSCH